MPYSFRSNLPSTWKTSALPARTHRLSFDIRPGLSANAKTNKNHSDICGHTLFSIIVIILPANMQCIRHSVPLPAISSQNCSFVRVSNGARCPANPRAYGLLLLSQRHPNVSSTKCTLLLGCRFRAAAERQAIRRPKHRQYLRRPAW